MRVTVKTPARLHLGLIDMNGDLGRLFGGLGVGIDRPNVVVEVKDSEQYLVEGRDFDLANSIVKRFLSTFGMDAKVAVKVVESIPTIFQRGGFVVDGGKSQKTNCFPPLIYRQPFPSQWRFVVAVPKSKEGLSNSQENHAFQELSAMSANEVGQICRLVMLRLLPALAEQDIESFGDAMTRIQVLTGKHFAQAQGGIYSSGEAADCIEFMKRMGAYGVGQSSWGPALYAVVGGDQAKSMQRKVEAYLRGSVGGYAFVARANNHGATIRVSED
jgi:beta-ribofuranosylaminobenzene 5'-phosphate synthase